MEMEEIQEQIGMLESRLAQLESREVKSYDDSINLLEGRLDQMGAQLNDVKHQLDNVPPSNVELIHSDDYEGFPEATMITPDGSSTISTAPVKKTIEFQPGTGAHAYELQLMNVDGIAVSKIGNVPFFTTDASGNGTLSWAQTETTYQVLQRKSGTPNTLAFDWVRAH